MSTITCRQAVAEYFSALRAMDVDRWVSIFAPDAESHDPVGTPPLLGHDALRQFLTEIFSVFETIGLIEDHIFVTGDSAAVKWTGLGRGRNGKDVIFEGIDVIECNPDGKIISVRAYWNPAPIVAAVTS
ncbi:MAG TPA: nuclear transport factor 2 family protein [Edaphobacter sp.]|jgi:steroid delta-isomerase|nr:nuclear transport factor 2 family protein [Edaphobacter sp.]